MMSVVARVIAPGYIILSLPCGEQKRQNPLMSSYHLTQLDPQILAVSDSVTMGLAILGVILLITLGAIWKYPQVNAVLQLWPAFGTLTGPSPRTFSRESKFSGRKAKSKRLKVHSKRVKNKRLPLHNKCRRWPRRLTASLTRQQPRRGSKVWSLPLTN